jgi:hypothetical protein
MSQSIPLNTLPCVIRLFISTVLHLSLCFDVGFLTAYARCCCYICIIQTHIYIVLCFYFILLVLHYVIVFLLTCSSVYVVHSPAPGVPPMVRVDDMRVYRACFCIYTVS